MPEATKRWLQRFVDGVNHYQATAKRLPFEYEVLALEREPWTVADVLAFGRLAGADVTWIVWFGLLKLRDRPDWPRIWERLLRQGGDRPPSTEASASDSAIIETLLAGLSRSGSNSLALAPERTRNGAAILANDPHLGINVPNTWILAGVKSPSYHAVGLMIPGLPLFAIGRNPWIAWGGTNMRATASDLVDVSPLPEAEKNSHDETIRVRWWPEQKVTLRSTRFGPILSDAPQLQDLNISRSCRFRWTGHRPSDEVTAMLKVMRARNFEEFRSAFASFGVPGQNMLYADAEGNIGQVLAVQIPDRRSAPEDLIVNASRSGQDLANIARRDQPAGGDEPRGRLHRVGEQSTLEWRRRRRLVFLAGGQSAAHGGAGRGQRHAQRRAGHGDAARCLRRLLGDAEPGTRTQDARGRRRSRGSGRCAPGVRAHGAWDGQYRADAQGPVAFELFRFHFTQEFYRATLGESDIAAFASIGRIKEIMVEDLERQTPEGLAPALRRSLDGASAKIGEFATWGDMHRLSLRHPLAFLPLIGRRFEFADYPIGGSTDSLMKTAHSSTRGAASRRLWRQRAPRLRSLGHGPQLVRGARRPGRLAEQLNLPRPGSALARGRVYRDAAAPGDGARTLPLCHGARPMSVAMRSAMYAARAVGPAFSSSLRAKRGIQSGSPRRSAPRDDEVRPESCIPDVGQGGDAPRPVRRNKASYPVHQTPRLHAAASCVRALSPATAATAKIRSRRSAGSCRNSWLRPKTPASAASMALPVSTRSRPTRRPCRCDVTRRCGKSTGRRRFRC